MSDSEKDGGNRSRWKKHGSKVVIVLGVTVLLFVGWRVWASYRVNAKLAALRAAGYPTSLAELERKYYPKITSGENGADYYVSAFGNLTNIPAGSWPTNASWADGNINLDAESVSSVDREKLLALVNSNGNLLNLLRSAPVRRNFRYPIDLAQGYSVPLTHLSKIGLCSRLLLMESALRCREGKIADAIADIDATFRLARSLEDEPQLISQLTRLRWYRAGAIGMVNVLRHTKLMESQLRLLQEMCLANRPPDGVKTGLVGYICSGIDFFQMPISKKADYLDHDGREKIEDRLYLGFLAFSGLNSTDFNFFLEYMTPHLKIEKLPLVEKMQAAIKLEEVYVDSMESGRGRYFHLYSNMLLPSLQRAHEREGATLAAFDSAFTAIGIERFRLANEGRLPANLEELTPKFMSFVPADPFDGRELRYKQLSPGYLIYSIGSDRKDDGGVTKDVKKGQIGEDIVFRVER